MVNSPVGGEQYPWQLTARRSLHELWLHNSFPTLESFKCGATNLCNYLGTNTIQPRLGLSKSKVTRLPTCLNRVCLGALALRNKYHAQCSHCHIPLSTLFNAQNRNTPCLLSSPNLTDTCMRSDAVGAFNISQRNQDRKKQSNRQSNPSMRDEGFTWGRKNLPTPWQHPGMDSIQ